MERYDPEMNAWEAVAPMGSSRDECGVAVLDDKAKPTTAMRVRVSPAYGSQAALQLNADMPHRAQQARAVGGRARNDSTTTKRPPLGYRLQNSKPAAAASSFLQVVE